MPISVSDFSALTDDLQEVFAEHASNKIADSVGLKIFDVKDTDRRTYDYLNLQGLAGVELVAEGADLTTASSVQGDTATWTQARYGKLVSVTKDMRIFDLHDQIRELVGSVTDDAFDKIDQSLADVLLNGWSTTYLDVYNQTVTSTGPDAVAVFSASHSNNINSNVFSNIITLRSSSTVNAALSRQAVVDAKAAARKYQDPNGIVRPVMLDTVVVGPDDEDLAYRIIMSSGVQGTSNVDTNEMLRGMKVVVWDRLAATGQGTSRSGYWFMYDSKKVKNSLKALFKERPTLDAPEQVYKNKNWEYSLDFYYAIGRAFPAYVFGSKGTNAA